MCTGIRRRASAAAQLAAQMGAQLAAQLAAQLTAQLAAQLARARLIKPSFRLKLSEIDGFSVSRLSLSAARRGLAVGANSKL